MQLPHGTTVAVLDGAKIHMFRNDGDEARLQLSAMPEPAISDDNKGSGARHQSSSANPGHGRLEEDSFAAGVAQWLNKQVLEGKIEDLFIIATPKTLGELRKHYHKTLEAKLRGEIAKDLTGHPIADIEKALSNA